MGHVLPNVGPGSLKKEWRTGMEFTYESVAGTIDHSLLHPTMTDRELEDGCKLAAEYRVATVCIKPYAIRRAAEILQGTGVGVCAVVAFPHGSSATAVKSYETLAACHAGATEIDMVCNVGKVLSSDWTYVAADILAVTEAAHREGALVKVIFETDYLADDGAKIRLCEVCAAAGADYVKTSTGFGFVKGADGRYSYQGATEHDLRLMRTHCPPAMGVKAAGGVRDLDSLLHCIELGCSRVGATATRAMLDEFRRRASRGPVCRL
jgi:deoxyribose-phosphate aldolase